MYHEGDSITSTGSMRKPHWKKYNIKSSTPTKQNKAEAKRVFLLVLYQNCILLLSVSALPTNNPKSMYKNVEDKIQSINTHPL